ncbi:hypothetical protein AVEN_73871-1 [Araneus ventricosus]|uniref:Uncharacterized protein n=1 Tax=Araneus ventricosus TaxID=182803 RepID=A0A4Y2G150_ARAVE|nr:hypothetical protein AVEN_73871-1 [Araneus ventricosus]
MYFHKKGEKKYIVQLKSVSFGFFLSFCILPPANDQFIGKNQKWREKKNFPAENFPFPDTPLGDTGQWSNQPENWKQKHNVFCCCSLIDTDGDLASKLQMY